MRRYPRSVLASVLIVAFGVGAAHAQAAVSGLGQSSPNTTDVSTSPNYHVYVFQRGTNRYIQVNDASGNVRGAVVRTPYSLLGVPVGSDATRVATPDEPLPVPASTTGETVYQDDSVKVFVAPQTDGTMQIRAVATECKNPLECTGKSP